MNILGKCQEFYKCLNFFRGISRTYQFKNFRNVLGELLYFIGIISKTLCEIWEIEEMFEKISRMVCAGFENILWKFQKYLGKTGRVY